MNRPPSVRVARAALVAIGAALVFVASWSLTSLGDLADPLATRWSFAGDVSATMSHTAFGALILLLVVPCVLVLFAVAGRRRPARAGTSSTWTGSTWTGSTWTGSMWAGSMWAGTAATVATIVSGAAWLTVVANRGRGDVSGVPGPALWQVGGVIAVGLVAGALAAWAAAGLPERASDPAVARPVDLPDSAVVAWTRSLTSWWLVLPGVISIVVGVVLLLVSADPGIGAVLVVVGAPVMLLARIEVYADRRGLTVTYGPWPWPRTRIRLDRIESVAAIDVVPTEWGGWGYRGSVRMFRRAAVVLRSGPGLQVDLVDGRAFVVTIDDPETAAAVIARELDRAPSAQP